MRQKTSLKVSILIGINTIDLLNKNPKKRMSIKDTLQHKWLKKYYNKIIEERQEIKGSAFKMYSTSDNIQYKELNFNNKKDEDDDEDNDE